MSTVAIRTALTLALKNMEPALDRANENGKIYEPQKDVPYQRVNILFAPPINNENAASHIETGFMQVTLMYPHRGGTTPAAARAELIRSTFPRGSSFTSGGVTVTIDKTPEIAPAMIEGDRYVVPVRVSFFAHIPA
jgi:hypothetical protein